MDTCELDFLFDGICSVDGGYCLKGRCPHDAYEHIDDPENCENCFHLDVTNYNKTYFCRETSYDNLKSFPFKKNMHCWVEK